MNGIILNNSIFENIKHIDENDNEYWLARELQNVLEYKEWRKFNNVISDAIIAYKSSGYEVEDHFSQVVKMVDIGLKTSRNITDYKLSRYACYLITQNGDARKKAIALAQTYFAVQTRKMEITEKEYSSLTEDEKRFIKEILLKKVIILWTKQPRKLE